MSKPRQSQKADRYVGTVVGESTSREFRLAISPGAVREQDIIAIDAELYPSAGEITSQEAGDKKEPQPELIRIWAKVQQIERINPLFPTEAGHELAATQTNPFDTVLSLSREMVTAVCQVLGYEAREGNTGGKLIQLRYPAQPATSAYSPDSKDIARIVLGELDQKQNRALDVATLANRAEVDVKIDGHVVVTRHLAILAMTGAGKSTAARRIIEELAKKQYPMVIFDPHGDYSKLDEVESLKGRVTRYFAQFPIFEEDSDAVINIVSALGYPLKEAMEYRFGDLFEAAKKFALDDEELSERREWLKRHISRPEAVESHGLQKDLFLIARLAEAGERVIAANDLSDGKMLEDWGWAGFQGYTGTDKRTLEGIKKRTYKAAGSLAKMESKNRDIARTGAKPLPVDKMELVDYGCISVVTLAGYSRDFQATIYALIAERIFEAKRQRALSLNVLFLLEEAHYFAPGKVDTEAEAHSTEMTKQIAQEGRKFGVGLILISQRPSRLDETTLSQCNSFIIMRMVNPADQNFVRKVVESLAEDEAKMLPDLDVGEAILSGQMINFPVLVKMKEPQSKGEREEEDAFVALEKARQSMQRPEQK